MGIPFPLGLTLINKISKPLSSFAWGINGFASVIGPILFQIIAIMTNFNIVIVCASFMYLSAYLVLLSLSRKKEFILK